MTFVRPAPGPGSSVGSGLLADVLTDSDRMALDRLVAADPIANAVIASRLAAFRSIETPRFGGALLGVRDEQGELTAAAFNGGNLLPIGGAPRSWRALADRAAAVPRLCTSVVGRADAVHTMWDALAPHWGPARAVRADQPLLVADRVDAPTDPRVRVMHPADLERYLPAAAAMFQEELGVSPFTGWPGQGYRRRVESLVGTGRAFGIVDIDGRMAFKADIGALTSATCQVQGVWVRPDLRGQGLGTRALAAVLVRALRLAPTVSLYVNDFNTVARRLYARLGMRQVGSLATVLL